MEVVTASDAPPQGRDLIRLICKRNKKLFVTRSLLTRSSTYFVAMLSEESGWEENSSKTIELVSWPRNDLATIFRSLMTKNTEPIFGDLNRYFAAINYFSITLLMEQCIEFKLNNVSDDNVIDDLKFAERFSISALKEKCMELLLERLPEVLRNSRKSRRRMTAELLGELLHYEKLSVRNEDEVLSIIDNWCSSGQRQSERVKLLREVRFAHLTEEAFEKCGQDAQCRELPQFRVLLETSRWSDLGENFLSGRKSTRVHYHVVGFIYIHNVFEELEFEVYDQSADELLLYCSETGALSTAPDCINKVYATSMCGNWHSQPLSIIYGNKLYVCQCTEECHEFQNPWVRTFTLLGFQHYSDYRDSAPSLTVRFPSVIYAAAPPVVFENDLLIAHMIYRGEPILRGGSYHLEDDHFDELELTRYRNGTASSRKLSVPTEFASRPNFCRDLLLKGANTLLVNDEWTILLVPNQGVLFVFDSPYPVGPVIEIPVKCWKFEEIEIDEEDTSFITKAKTFSDLVIAGNIAYVLLNFHMHADREDFSDFADYQVGSITAYNLTEGKWLPEHFLDLATFFKARALYEEFFKISLKIVDSDVFVFFLSNFVDYNDPPLPLTSLSYVYRLQRSANSLWMSPASDRAIINGTRPYKETCPLYRWKGVFAHVDTCPCKYGTKLQAKASQEQDPIEREKLRRFIW